MAICICSATISFLSSKWSSILDHSALGRVYLVAGNHRIKVCVHIRGRSTDGFFATLVLVTGAVKG